MEKKSSGNERCGGRGGVGEKKRRDQGESLKAAEALICK